MQKTDIINKIVEYLKKEHFILKKQEQLLSNSWKKSTIDFSIYTESQIFTDSDLEINALVPTSVTVPFGIIVSTSSGNDRINLTYAKRVIKRVIEDSAFWFGMVVDKNIHAYYVSENNSSNDFSWQKLSMDEVFELFQKYRRKKIDEDKFKTTFEEALSNVKTQSKRDEIIFNAIKSSVSEDTLTQYGRTVTTSLKSQFKLVSEIMKQLGIATSNSFCRYTSFGSLHRIIDNNRESMCGLAVMNDKSEGFYLDKCISQNSSFNIWTRPQFEIDEYNNAFITSLCERSKSDDLTMWRLYGGDDGDGVCLEYDIDIDQIKKSSNLLLMPVQYGNTNNPIIQLFRIIKKLPYIGGYQFVLSYKNIFRYFVKPSGFKIEEEYRLLLIRNKIVESQLSTPKWIYNSKYNIFNPIQELLPSTSTESGLKSPLILKKIILGPKSKESKVNVVQLRTWLNQLGLSNINVEESKIDFYR